MEWSAKRRRTGGNDGTAGGASGTHASTEDQEVANSSEYNYEVFLNFRGPDTRAGFTDFLYTSMMAAGIRAFRDDEELRKGEEFAPELLQAIEQSKISIPIFSQSYASSKWCLKELVQMVECRKNGRQKIMPIFYDVSPSEVQHQIGGYAEAFLSHEKKQRYNEETIHEWKAALSAVGAINGWDLHSKTNRQEGKFAKEVTEEVFRELKRAYLVVSDHLVSVDNHVDAIMEMIGVQTGETRIVGIHGMGGIGKTTIAKIIYNKLSSNFKDCCFLSNIRETSEHKGIECLQNQLISGILKIKRTYINNVDEGIETIKKRLSKKRVLLLLDDVEKENHIDAFVGKRDWLSRGSKIIITTRNKDILYVPKVDYTYELKCMDRDRSLQLFSKHAFRRDSPSDKYMDQSNWAIRIAGGLPLALEVIGSLLCRTKKEKWNGKLKELENVPPEDVLSKLKISYNALCEREQHIFLDIACLFIGYEKDIVIFFWDESIFFPKEAMDVLENMSLIKINDNNEVWMHDQLRDLGREIVRRESNLKIEKQSRVWDPKQGSDFMRRLKGNKEVEALCVNFDDQRSYCFTYEAFESLSNLRFLDVRCWDRYFCVKERLISHESSSNLIPENSDLLPQLQWFSWRNIPPTFNIMNFSMENVVILDLSYNDIMEDWKGWSHMKNLKVLDLSDCCMLERLPDKLGEDLASLEYLNLGGCSSLKGLPDTIGNLKSLIKLDISMLNIKELPDSIGKLQNLKAVYMFGYGVEKIPYALWTLEKVEEIERIKDYPSNPCHMKIGDCIYKNQSLRILRLWGQDIHIYELPRLPESLIILELGILGMDTYPDLSNLTNLKQLDLSLGCPDRSFCCGPEELLPRWIGNLRKLEFLGLWLDWGANAPTCLSFLDHPEIIPPPPPRLPSSLSSLRGNCENVGKYYVRWEYRI